VDFPGPARGWALPSEQAGYERELPAAVRALVLARLGPRPGDLLWDIGAGDGAVAVEAARCGAAVIAVDRDPDACARLDVNARRAGVEVQTVPGTAPEALADLPEPDVVLVRQGADVLRACLARRPERIVAVPSTLGQAEEVRRAFAAAGYTVSGTLLQSSPMGASGELGAAVPRCVIWGDR
jgi:precorrin-6Y C5,15-methyltransferase (decarboxylating)